MSISRRGLNDIGELKEIYKDKIQDLKNKASVQGVTAPPSTDQLPPQPSPQDLQGAQWPKPPPPPTPQANPSTANLPPGVKTLSSYLDVDKAAHLPQRELEALWRLRFAQNPQSLCAAVPAHTWQTIARSARRHPQFILPGLPREAKDGEQPQAAGDYTGAPIHFVQWTFTSAHTVTVLFTHLAEFKLRGEHAQPHTTLTHHLEFRDDKGLVLCQGSVVPDRGVSVEEGRWLVLQLQKFYNIGDEAEANESSQVGKELKQNRRRLVEMFSAGDQSFKVEELFEEADRLG